MAPKIIKNINHMTKNVDEFESSQKYVNMKNGKKTSSNRFFGARINQDKTKVN